MESEPVKLMTARTNFEAKVVVSVLAGAGIEAFSSTGNLMDEFAVSQAMMNLQGADVLVRASKLESAKQVVAEAREAGHFAEEDPAEGGSGGEDPAAGGAG